MLLLDAQSVSYQQCMTHDFCYITLSLYHTLAQVFLPISNQTNR